MRLLLLAGDVRTNMGDRAIRAALVRMIRARDPGAEVTVLSRTPERDAREFGVTILGRSAAALFMRAGALHRLDAVAWGGGQLLQDDSSLVKNLYWAVILTWLRRVLRLRIAGLGLGLGPLDTAIGRRLAAAALSNLDLFIGRDERSCAWARTLTHGRLPTQLAPDPAIFLQAASPGEALRHLAAAGVPRADGDIVVGVSVRRWFHLGRRRILPYALGARDARAARDAFDRFLDRFTNALKLFAADKPVRFLFFPMADADWEGDAVFARRMAAGLDHPAHILRLDCDASMTKALAGLCDLFVGVRMHPCLLALSMGVPAVGVYHVPKVRDFFETVGQADCTLAMEDVAADGGEAKLADLLNRTHGRRREIAAALRTCMGKLAENAGVYRSALDSIYEPADR